MYRIVRLNNKETEVLKDTSTETPKTFDDYEEARILVNKLNSNEVTSNVEWTIEEL